MKGGIKAQGYTIVEVMIVLAVSGVMFLIAAQFVSGKQAKTAFNEGVTTLAANIQGVIEAVIDGQYTDIPLACSVQSGSAPGPTRYLTFSAGGKQGTSQDCTFLGTMIHFRPAGTATSYDTVYLAGAKIGSSGGAISSITDSAITPVTAGVNLTKTATIPQGLQVGAVQVTYSNGGTMTDNGGFNFGVVQSQGVADTSANAVSTFESGAQSVSMIVTPALESADNLASNLNQGNTYNASKAIICLTDGTRKAQITVGDSGNQLKAIADFSGVGLLC